MPGHIIIRMKIVESIEIHALHILRKPVDLITVFYRSVCVIKTACHSVCIALSIQKQYVFSGFQKFSDHPVSLYGSTASAKIDNLPFFHPAERFLTQKGIKVFYNLHIRIHINTAVPVENIQPRIIRHESISSLFISFLHIDVLFHIVIILIPLHNFIIGTIFFPAVNTPLQAGRNLLFSEPHVMYFFRYQGLVRENRFAAGNIAAKIMYAHHGHQITGHVPHTGHPFQLAYYFSVSAYRNDKNRIVFSTVKGLGRFDIHAAVL